MMFLTGRLSGCKGSVSGILWFSSFCDVCGADCWSSWFSSGVMLDLHCFLICVACQFLLFLILISLILTVVLTKI